MIEKEKSRILIERALQAGRRFQGVHTQCVHYNALDPESRETIPVYENALFALALLKSRTAETVAEARVILERILYHQSHPPSVTAGNFPIYFHESPHCYSRWMGAKLFAPLYAIYKGFHTVLGDELRQKTSSALLALSEYALRSMEQHTPDYGVRLQIGAGLFAVGSLLKQPELESCGRNILDDLLLMGQQCFWLSRDGIGEMLISLQMVYGKISESPWRSFWEHLKRSWHPVLQTYRGPAFEEFQKGAFPDSSLYDAYFALFRENECIHDLHAILIADTQECIETGETLCFESETKKPQWIVDSSPSHTWSAIDQVDPNFRTQKGFHPFYLQWKGDKELHSLVCAGGRFSQMRYERTQHGLDLIFTLSEPVENDHPLENREIVFYCSTNNPLKISVQGHSATTFKLGETVEILSGGKISMRFTLETGEGQFLGHLMPGNRPAQLLATKNRPQQAFDRQIFLRTLRKAGPCVVRVSIEIISV